MKKMKKLTESEEIVMKAVWDCDFPPQLSDIHSRTVEVYDKDWKPQTVSTFLSKLVYKKYLKLNRKGKIYTYKTLVSMKDYKRQLYLEHINFWDHDDVVEFLASMVQNGDLSQEELEQIKIKES